MTDSHGPHRDLTAPSLDEDFDCALPTRDGAAAAAAGGRTRGAAGRSLVVLRALAGASLGVCGAPRDLPCLGQGQG
jgi:hypothetical protein